MDYNDLKQRASELIGEYSDLSISYTTTDTTGYEKRYNPVTNIAEWYYNGVASSAPQPTTYTGVCIETNISDYFRAKGFVRESERVVLTSDIPTPNIGDKLIIGGIEHSVVRAVPIKPSSVEVLLKITVRR